MYVKLLCVYCICAVCAYVFAWCAFMHAWNVCLCCVYMPLCVCIVCAYVWDVCLCYVLHMRVKGL